MIIGLSGDIIGKAIADTFRSISKLFLQWSFIILAVIMIPASLLAYGERVIFLFYLILLASIVGILEFMGQKHFSLKKWLKSFKSLKKSGRNSKGTFFILGLIFFSSLYGMLSYPHEWFASFEIVFLAYILASITIAIIILFKESKDNDTYTSDDDYYY